MSESEWIKNLQKENRKEADCINELFGLGDEDHKTALEVGHLYSAMKAYAKTETKSLEQQLKGYRKALTEIKDCANRHCNNFDQYNDFVYLTAEKALKGVK